jgi:hypothetical protein
VGGISSKLVVVGGNLVFAVIIFEYPFNPFGAETFFGFFSTGFTGGYSYLVLSGHLARYIFCFQF